MRGIVHHRMSRLAKGSSLDLRASSASTNKISIPPTTNKKDDTFLKRWDEAKAAQMLPSSGLSGWRSQLLENATALLLVEDFLDGACNIVRMHGGSMLSTEFGDAYQRRHEGNQINTCGCVMVDWELPNSVVKKDGTSLSMGEILEACTRLLVEDTQELGLRRISLRLNEEGMEVKGPEGTQLIVISQDKVSRGVVGVSGVMGAVQSILDYAVDEVLETHGYREDDRIILFDGVCNLCNTAVNFILDHDVEEKFKFAALQSETGHALLRKARRDPNDMSTMVLSERGKVYDKSDAVLRIGSELDLPGIMSTLALAARIFVPKPLRDWFYSDVISKNRVKWFGSSDSCRLMDEGLEKRFYK